FFSIGAFLDEINCPLQQPLKVTYKKQMEHSTRENQRYYIFVEWKNGSTAAEIHQKLVVAEGDQALSSRTIHCWIEAFELGKQSVKDEARSGCPREAVTPATIGKVEDLVSEDHHITTRKLSEEVGISDERIIYIIPADYWDELYIDSE